MLDNCEHLPRVAPLVANLLSHCPYLAILATSRAPLRLRAEHTLPLDALALDDAVALFHERALAVRPDGVYDESEIVSICERLDCLPLAIELAAAWVRVLPLPQLRDHLACRLPLLQKAPRTCQTASARWRTPLAGAMASSPRSSSAASARWVSSSAAVCSMPLGQSAGSRERSRRTRRLRR